jgi:hypothetical protein
MTMGVSEYLPRSKNILGHKEIELGTGYREPVSWLIGSDDPISVLHVKGVLLDVNGKILRAGAEGIIHQTPSLKEFLENMENFMQGDFTDRVFTEKKLKEILIEKRKDLPGTPYLWQAAVQNLIAQLLGKRELLL